MTVAPLVLAGVAWLVGLALLGRLPTPRSAPAAGGRGSLAAATSVIVPVRDEATTLPPLLASLAVQDPPPLEVIVVDDGSTDGSGAVARGHGAEVVDPGPLPAGALGKPWACAAGVARARGAHLVLLDADVRLAPDALDRLLDEHLARAADGLLSVQPFHDVRRVDEHASLFPNVVALLASGIGAPRPSRRPGVAFGPCLVTTPAALAAVGGYEAVLGEVLEDAALARRFEAAGRPVRVLAGGATVRFRMFPDASSLVRGWLRLLAGGARRARTLPTVGAVAWVAALVAVALGLAAPSVASLGAYALAAAQVAWAARRAGSFSWVAAALYPLPLLAFVALFSASVVLALAGGSVAWRGRPVAPR